MAEDGGMHLFKDRSYEKEREEHAADGGRVCVYLQVCMPVNSVGKRGVHRCSEAGCRRLWEAIEWSFARFLCLKTVLPTLSCRPAPFA